MGPERRRPYTDLCPECDEPEYAAPILVQRERSGRGVVADYLCSAGHTWFTGWQQYGDREQAA